MALEEGTVPLYEGATESEGLLEGITPTEPDDWPPGDHVTASTTTPRTNEKGAQESDQGRNVRVAFVPSARNNAGADDSQGKSRAKSMKQKMKSPLHAKNKGVNRN